jgi:adenosylcobyric acid synthase
MAPLVEMNPILLKSGKTPFNVQVVVLGRVLSDEPWRSYTSRFEELFEVVVKAYNSFQVPVICEGAGSCVELNLQRTDLVNLPLRRRLKIPWVLVADIERGGKVFLFFLFLVFSSLLGVGIFAQVIGVMHCVSDDDWQQCRAVIVNKMRGDASLFEDGRAMLEERVGKKIFVVPYLENLHIDEEDSAGLQRLLRRSNPQDLKKIQIVLPAAPYLSNASDLTALLADSELQVHVLEEPPTGDFHVGMIFCFCSFFFVSSVLS